jgi:hypothetical protein
MERMVDFRPHAGLQVFQLFRQATPLSFWQRLAFGLLHGHILRDRFANVFWPLFYTLIAGIAKRGDFIVVQQRVRLGHVGDIAGRANDRVHQA